MTKNTKVTSDAVATLASKVLRSKTTSKILKTLAASVLTQNTKGKEEKPKKFTPKEGDQLELIKDFPPIKAGTKFMVSSSTLVPSTPSGVPKSLVQYYVEYPTSKLVDTLQYFGGFHTWFKKIKVDKKK